MIRKAGEMPKEAKDAMRGGQGRTEITTLLQPGEYKGRARLIGEITLEPGASIGAHVHEEEEEVFYILEGSADFNDNGTSTRLEVGDVCLTVGGEQHSIANAGDGPLRLLALILLY